VLAALLHPNSLTDALAHQARRDARAPLIAWMGWLVLSVGLGLGAGQGSVPNELSSATWRPPVRGYAFAPY
jgi:hypothetical protein